MALRHVARAALDLVLPPHCPTCDTPTSAPGLLCAPCHARTTLLGAACCTACATPFPAPGFGPLCPDCTATPPPWGEARAAIAYDDQARRLLLPFKYGDRTELLRTFVPLLARAGAPLLARADVLVPVPLHRARLRARRYNQSALLARALAAHGFPPAVPDALLRTRRTPSLGPLSPARRDAALAGAIIANPRHRARLLDARVLLIDDVLTSGATARACTAALLDVGAGAVDLLVVARVPGYGPS